MPRPRDIATTLTTLAGTESLVADQASGNVGKITADNARRFLATQPRTTFSNANYTVLATDRYVAQTGSMSTPRTVTLPAANAVPAGTTVTISDESGSV